MAVEVSHHVLFPNVIQHLKVQWFAERVIDGRYGESSTLDSEHFNIVVFFPADVMIISVFVKMALPYLLRGASTARRIPSMLGQFELSSVCFL